MNDFTYILQNSLQDIFLPTVLRIILPVITMIFALLKIKVKLSPFTKKSKMIYFITEMTLFLALGTYIVNTIPKIITEMPLPEPPKLEDSSNPFVAPSFDDSDNPLIAPSIDDSDNPFESTAQ